MRIRPFLIAFAGIYLPISASAHEVYVLPPSVAARAVAEPSFSGMQVLLGNQTLFLFWAFVALILVGTIFFASISTRLERLCDPFLRKLPRYAPVIGRITIGLSFLSAAYFGALFGPELPLAGTFGESAPLVRAVLALSGLMLVLGWYARIAALAGLALFVGEVAAHGAYLLTYTNYLGEFILLLILGAHELGIHDRRDDLRAPDLFQSAKRALAPLAFPILRIAFGISLLYASLYAKVLHNHLALAVAEEYPAIAAFFGLEPHFLVLGAAIVEIVVALFFIFGIEIRFTSLFLLFWLFLSLLYFGEAVWPHLILIGIPLAFICYGYDRYSLEGRFAKRGGREPVL